MGWQPAGSIAITATTPEVAFGWFSGDLLEDRLLVRLTSSAGGTLRPLSFGIVGFIGDDGTRSLGEARYYPQPEPSVVALGFGDLSQVSGRLVFRARGYNLQWLKAGIPGRVWNLSAEVFITAGVTAPTYTPAGFADGAIQKIARAVDGAVPGLKLAQVAWND